MNDAQIEVVAAPQRAEALGLILSRHEAEERRAHLESLSAEAESGPVAAEGLLGAYRGGRLVGAVFSQLQPGKTAMVWPPQTVADEPPATAEMLLTAACRWLARREVRIAQILLRPDLATDEATWRRVGFKPLSDLLYLVSQENQFPTHLPKGPLTFQIYSAANQQRLAQVIQATYEQTLDCPGLDNVRQIEDVLDGYRATGVFDPGRWLIVRHMGQDIGCLLLADHPEHGNWELVYMGVVAASRGHGWGKQIARHAQWLTRQAGRPRLVLAVDAENRPAIEMYTAVGFERWDRRRAYLKVF